MSSSKVTKGHSKFDMNNVIEKLQNTLKADASAQTEFVDAIRQEIIKEGGQDALDEIKEGDIEKIVEHLKRTNVTKGTQSQSGTQNKALGGHKVSVPFLLLSQSLIFAQFWATQPVQCP